MKTWLPSITHALREKTNDFRLIGYCTFLIVETNFHVFFLHFYSLLKPWNPTDTQRRNWTVSGVEKNCR